MNSKVKAAIRSMCYQTLGGWENSVTDGDIKEMPTYKEMEQEVYYEVIHCSTFETESGWLISVGSEIKFAGKENIMEYIKKFLRTIDCDYEIKEG